MGTSEWLTRPHNRHLENSGHSTILGRHCFSIYGLTRIPLGFSSSGIRATQRRELNGGDAVSLASGLKASSLPGDH